MYLWTFYKPQPLLQAHWMKHYLTHPFLGSRNLAIKALRKQE